MKVQVSHMTKEEIPNLNKDGLRGETLARERKVVVFTDNDGNSGQLYVENSTIQQLGIDYIAANSKLEYSSFFDTWYPQISENAYYNDLARNPPKTISVRFIEEKNGENTEVWKDDETGQYFLRLLCNKPFARWMTCRGRARNWEDIGEVRANITFQNGNQTESTKYDDWNGVAAYSDMFNPNFRNGGGQQE